MSARRRKGSTAALAADPREAITFFRPMEEREAEMAPLRLSLIRRIAGTTRPHAALRNRLLLLTVLRGLQLPALAWMIGAAITGPISNRQAGGALLYAAGFLLLAILTAFTLHFRQRLALRIGEAVAHDLRSGLFRKLTTLPMSFFDKTKFGRIFSRMTSDIESIRVGVQEVAFVTIVTGFQMLGAAVLMFQCNAILFSMMLLLVPLIWVINNRYRREMSRSLRAVQESWSRLTSTLAESVNGIRVTQAFVRQEINAGFFRKLVISHADYNIGVARASAVFVPLLQMKSQLFLGLMLLVGGFGALQWQGPFHMEAGDLVQFFFLANLFFEPVQLIGNQVAQAMTAMAGAERFFRLIDLEPSWKDRPSAQPIPRILGRVEFQGVHFAYEEGRPVLEDISFAVEPGQTVALVGPTGSGKTTIAGLLQKFHLPGSGRILIDGRDLLDVTGDSLHAQMGSVAQSNFLFSDSCLDNIRFARPEATVEEVRATLRALDCLDIIESLPQGLETQVGEKGASISMGQRQLICFARALIADPRILVLDEATSAIDTVTEERLKRALEVLLRGRTSFVVAHRLSTIRRADLVLVLDQGRIVERGTHEQLLAAGGAYARLHEEFVRGGASTGI